MIIKNFPNPERTSAEGLLALGGDLEPESLLLAYRQGIFPWPMDGIPVAWFCPPRRAILEWHHLHISKSLAKERRKNRFSFTIDQAFESVIQACASLPRPGQQGTWITSEMCQAYLKLHTLGHAHSVEVWNAHNQLVGGIYGVNGGGSFAGESMFHLEPNASKLAILFLMEHLFSRGLDWIDIQVMTPHMEAMGAKLIGRKTFLKRLQAAQDKNLSLFD